MLCPCQVIALADKVVAAVKSGKIKKFVVMAGCDGRMKSREYYTEFAKALPKDTVILTAAAPSTRYNKIKNWETLTASQGSWMQASVTTPIPWQ